MRSRRKPGSTLGDNGEIMEDNEETLRNSGRQEDNMRRPERSRKETGRKHGE